jgi:hypothetical protein
MHQPPLSFFQDHFSYDPKTGDFTNLKERQRVPAGSIAGVINDHGYVVIWFKSKKYLAHRLAWLFMTGAWPKEDVDHEDRVRSNNIWTNLREATGLEQNQNTSKYSNNTSGYTGVSWHKSAKAWMASIQFKGKKHTSFHATPELASDWYKAKKAELHLFNPVLK